LALVDQRGCLNEASGAKLQKNIEAMFLVPIDVVFDHDIDGANYDPNGYNAPTNIFKM
jgi:hypothetical protein